MHISLANIRKPWAVLLAYCVVAFIVGLYPYFTIVRDIQPIQFIQAALDAAIIYGLYGYVFRKPIRNLALRLLYIVLVLVICTRAAAVIYFVGPNLSPWEGDREQYVSVFILLGIPIGLLAALGLWLYATKSQVAQTSLPESTGAA